MVCISCPREIMLSQMHAMPRRSQAGPDTYLHRLRQRRQSVQITQQNFPEMQTTSTALPNGHITPANCATHLFFPLRDLCALCERSPHLRLSALALRSFSEAGFICLPRRNRMKAGGSVSLSSLSKHSVSSRHIRARKSCLPEQPRVWMQIPGQWCSLPDPAKERANYR